ncbi:involved in bacteriocin production or immunity [Bacillus phage Slash]|uniref:Uncharacterized protein n=2 Tax=Slashvirus TaxID=1921709 RepID=U5Q1A2_9CAUD|nr:involved in bacteriocin production or immunity [Bacillus phage Staley]YP_008771959.1 involved in bacteriocin production or immunity [Bacillus phage Slash]AGY48346.1 hypothetical protein Slash_57 [Bacillus phage Slash]AGY48742.1 hypothetical protein Staley_59 [Bacillus phage Staley]
MVSEITKTASELAGSQFVFGILFILLLVAVLWSVHKAFTQVQQNNIAQANKMDDMHLQRQAQLMEILQENKSESKEREEKLYAEREKLVLTIDRYNDQLEAISDTQANTNETLNKMQDNLENLQSNFTEMNYSVRVLNDRVDRIERKN